jgi:hypothetical protein
LTTSASAPCCTNRSRRALRLLLVLNGAESEMAVLAVAPGKELAVLGHGDGGAVSARYHYTHSFLTH